MKTEIVIVLLTERPATLCVLEPESGTSVNRPKTLQQMVAKRNKVTDGVASAQLWNDWSAPEQSPAKMPTPTSWRRLWRAPS